MTARRRGPWRALSALLVASVAAGALGVALSRHLREPTHRAAALPAATPRASLPASPREATVLVMASDAKGDAGRSSTNGNTDTLLLVHMDPAHHALSALAIPRDTRARIPGHGTFKINAANVWGGPELAVRSVSELLGVHIDHYLVVNLHGVRALVDAMGGVEVTVPKPMHYVDHAGGLRISFSAGRQPMTGLQVEEYLRFRHDDAGDIGRVQRQQAFLLELARQVLRPGEILRIPLLYAVLREHARTDLAPWQVVGLMPMFRGLDPKRDLELTMLPGREDSSDGPWYWRADVEAVRPFLARHFQGAPPEPEALAPPRVTIENHTGEPASALSALVERLEDEGFRVKDLKAARLLRHCRVIAQRGDREGAERLQKLLGEGEVVVAGIGAITSDFTLEVGEDWLATQAALPPQRLESRRPTHDPPPTVTSQPRASVRANSRPLVGPSPRVPPSQTVQVSVGTTVSAVGPPNQGTKNR